jgi:hypothetical protein
MLTEMRTSFVKSRAQVDTKQRRRHKHKSMKIYLNCLIDLPDYFRKDDKSSNSSISTWGSRPIEKMQLEKNQEV